MGDPNKKSSPVNAAADNIITAKGNVFTRAQYDLLKRSGLNFSSMKEAGDWIDAGGKTPKQVLHTQSPPKQFLEHYMESPEYQRRLAQMGAPQNPKAVNNMLNTHIIETNNPNQGSEAFSLFTSRKSDEIKKNWGIDKLGLDPNRANIVYNPTEGKQVAKATGHTLPGDSTIAHELSHVTRALTPQEQIIIGNLNKTEQGKLYMKGYLNNQGKAKDFQDYMFNYTLGEGDNHDNRPGEIKADLDALRYLMYKNKIYDTSKREMTLDDYKKASQHPEIKNTLIFNRLKKVLDPSQLILLNNTVAANKEDSQNNTLV